MTGMKIVLIDSDQFAKMIAGFYVLLEQSRVLR